MIRDHEKLGENLWDRFNAPKSDQKWYYTSLVSVFENNPPYITDIGLLQQFKKKVERLFPSAHLKQANNSAFQS